MWQWSGLVLEPMSITTLKPKKARNEAVQSCFIAGIIL